MDLELCEPQISVSWDKEERPTLAEQSTESRQFEADYKRCHTARTEYS